MAKPKDDLEKDNPLDEEDDDLEDEEDDIDKAPTNGEGRGMTFQPASFAIEKAKRPPRPVRPKLQSLENLHEHAKNRYEGVLIAAARARQLNAKKVALEERGLDEAMELKRYKMTSHALGELLSGQIKVRRTGEAPPA
ncbi:MAG TPA: DNA-directed RNA polymerase subunit omega [candidate division Zixibacteria bacterium]|jgi:DNA-directed RNA polymerase omega subunit